MTKKKTVTQNDFSATWHDIGLALLASKHNYDAVVDLDCTGTVIRLCDVCCSDAYGAIKSKCRPNLWQRIKFVFTG